MDSTATENAQNRTASAEARIGTLRSELEGATDRARQALIQYEIGHIVEHTLGNEAQAVREYLAAYNLDPTFRPPLIALISIFERRRSTKNLARLYDAEARSATDPIEAASAVADRAILMADHLGEKTEARALLEGAYAQAPESQAIALLYEHELLSSGDRTMALDVIATRAELTKDDVLATLLRLELARAKEDDGDVDGALSILRSAVSTPAARWRVLEQLERVARRAGRHAERIVALEGSAKLALAEARGEDQGQQSGAFSVHRFADEARAGAEAAALYREAARLRITQLNDAAGARRDYDAALELRPDDSLLRYEHMLACELGSDLETAAADARTLLDAGIDGASAAALHFRLAERAQMAGDPQGALAEMRAAVSADPSSPVASAMLDDLLRGTGDIAGAIDQLSARAESGEGGARAQRYTEASQLAADLLGDFPRARALIEKGAESATDPVPMLRELYGAALRLGDPEGARAAAEGMLARDLDDEERSALLRDMHELSRLVIEDQEGADSALERALAAPAAGSWAPDLARLYGIVNGNTRLAVRGHLALGMRAADAETAAAHYAAAARLLMKDGQTENAVETLRRALERSPSHPYAVALLEEVLRARGDADELVRLLKEAADASDAPRAAEARLLQAGAEAEASGDVTKAVQTYEQAADRDPTSLAPPLAIKRLAESKNDKELLLRALEALSQREIANGAPGRHTLALGEHYDLVSAKPELAEGPLRTALDGESVATHAAFDIALLPVFGGEGAVRLAGLSHLLARAGDAHTLLLREAAGVALSDDPAAADGMLRELRERAPSDQWAQLATLSLLAPDRSRVSDRAAAWLALGHTTQDHEAAAELLVHGLRTTMISLGEEGIDDAVILAHDVMAVAPDSLAAAAALDETLSAGDDPDGRADALGSWLSHTGDAGKIAMESARGRALAAAGRFREGLEVLLRVAAAKTDDLASWEAIRVCARECQIWDPLVEACDRLAHLCEDAELACILLEESAAVLMDELHQDDRAERRLRRILSLDAKRPIAYGRLHDLLADHGDDAGLLELVSARIELIDDSEELGKLFYEQARLMRALGMREEALGALDSLLMLDAQHVGGLALLVELQVLEENWAGAVEALRTLAAANDVPDSQRRIAHLGAADFLQDKIGDLPGAYRELTALETLGLADAAILERTASVAEELSQWGEATLALTKAAAIAASPAERARLERRAGLLHAEKRNDRDAAIMAYARAMRAVPTDLDAADALAALLDPESRIELSQRFEKAVRDDLEDDPTDPEALRKLRFAADWREDRGMDAAILATLIALAVADEDERDAFTDHTQLFGRPMSGGMLDGPSFDSIRIAGDGGPVMALALSLAENLAELDVLEPETFRIHRNDALRADHPLRAEITVLCGQLGVPAPDVWQGGDVPMRIDVMPYYKGRPNFVLGPGVRTPLVPEQRFIVGRLAAGLRMGVAPFIRRDPPRTATALFAAAAAAEVPLPAGENRAGMAETTRRIYKVMPRRVRKNVADLVRALGDDGRSIFAWSEYVHLTASRAGMLVAGDLASCLRIVLGQEPERESVLESPPARDLLTFWLSPGALLLRQRLGLST